MDSNIARYIITGAPGTGKSSVLKKLKEKNYICHDEISRQVIQEQQAINGDAQPWLNLESFVDKCFHRMLLQLNCNDKGIHILDRAIPDLIAYLASKNKPISKDYLNHIFKYKKQVFFFPLWPEIYINDAQRPQTLEDAEIINHHIRKTYSELGFELITVPFSSIDERIAFIENHIHNTVNEDIKY